jgi:hypothetical protein
MQPVPADHITDICDEFDVDEGFVRFSWAVLQEFEKLKPASSAVTQLRASKGFLPQTIREMALGIAVALQNKKLRKRAQKLLK